MLKKCFKTECEWSRWGDVLQNEIRQSSIVIKLSIAARSASLTTTNSWPLVAKKSIKR